MTTPPESPTAAQISQWLAIKVSEHLRVDPGEVRLDLPLIAHGVDSVQFIALIGELEDWLHCRFRDNPLMRYPTISALSEFLARQLADGKSVIDPHAQP